MNYRGFNLLSNATTDRLWYNGCRQYNIANAVSVSKNWQRRFVQIRVKNRMYKIHLRTRIWSEILLEELIVFRLVNVIHTFYGFTSVRNWTLSSGRWVRSDPHHHVLFVRAPLQYKPPTQAHISQINSSIEVLIQKCFMHLCHAD
jgi:hypothetical protein